MLFGTGDYEIPNRRLALFGDGWEEVVVEMAKPYIEKGNSPRNSLIAVIGYWCHRIGINARANHDEIIEAVDKILENRSRWGI